MSTLPPHPNDDPLLTVLGETRAAQAALDRAVAEMRGSIAEMRGSINGALLVVAERQREHEAHTNARLATLEQSHGVQTRDWVDVCTVLFLLLIAGGIWIGVLL